MLETLHDTPKLLGNHASWQSLGTSGHRLSILVSPSRTERRSGCESVWIYFQQGIGDFYFKFLPISRAKLKGIQNLVSEYPPITISTSKKQKRKKNIISFEKIVSEILFLPLIEPLSVNRAGKEDPEGEKEEFRTDINGWDKNVASIWRNVLSKLSPLPPAKSGHHYPFHSFYTGDALIRRYKAWNAVYGQRGGGGHPRVLVGNKNENHTYTTPAI